MSNDKNPLCAPPPGVDELVWDDGEPFESSRHRDQMVVLIEILNLHWRHRNDFHVGGNEFFYFSETQSRQNDFQGPDFYVVLDTERRERMGWAVWLEDGRAPDLIIEITSESTRAEDYGLKMRVYERQVQVPEYYIYDPFTGQLDGFRRGGTLPEYEPILPNEHSRLSSRMLRLELGVVQGEHQGAPMPWLRWFTPDGTMLPTDGEELRRVEAEWLQERQRAEQETRQAEQ